MGKIFERILANRLVEWLKAVRFYGDGQHGFMEGKSTVTAMLALQWYVTESQHRYVLDLFLDISGAFDNALAYDLPPTEKL